MPWAGALELVPNALGRTQGAHYVSLDFAIDDMSAVAGGVPGLTCMVMIASSIFCALVWLHQAGR